MHGCIYADNAATTRLEPEAFEAMRPWLVEEYGNASQPYSFARKPRKALAESRALIASCINAEPEEIYFTSGGTESDNWAIKGSALANMSADAGALITSAFEHQAVLHACEAIERLRYPVAYIYPAGNGVIAPESLERMITGSTRMVSIMYANNELGTIQPIKELCSIAHCSGAIFHTDAVQAVGHIELDVRDLNIDMLSASAHKFNGPKGVGFLFVRKGLAIRPYADGGAQEHGLRAGTENIAGIVGMARALQLNMERLARNIAHVRRLEDTLLQCLGDAGIPFIRNGDVSNALPGIVSLAFAGVAGEAMLHRLDLMGICISTGSACNGRSTEISHVLKAIGLHEALAKGTIRISLGKDNSIEDVHSIAQALAKIVKDVRAR